MAEERKKGRPFDLPETRGAFQVKGIVTGTEKDGFYRERETRTGKGMRTVSFGVAFAEGSTLYVTMQGFEQDSVYFSRRAEGGGKPDVERVPWADRHSYSRDGYRLIGKSIGVRKKVDQDGRVVNDRKVLTDYDACKEVADNLRDGASVYVRGSIDYSSYRDGGGEKKLSVRLAPSQVSLCADVDLSGQGGACDFNQVIIYTGIEQERPQGAAPRYAVSAKVVTYKGIEDASFVIENKDLAAKFKKGLKPYDAIKVSGRISVVTPTETVANDDEWGEADAIERVIAPTRREFVITGANGATIDREAYSQERVEAALARIAESEKAENAYGGDSDDWGDAEDIPW